MSLSNPRSFYGVHSVAPYNRSTREYFGILKVLGSSSLNFSGELVPLNGGSSKFPFHVEDSLITAELALTFREYPDFVFELFLGKAVTSNAAEAAGSTTALANATGTSAFDATTGMASVTVESGSEANVKFNKYVIKVTSADAVDVFAGSDADFARGVDSVYQNDLLKITVTPITVPDAGATVSIPGTGLEITGGSGTVAMTIGDTAIFSSKPINTGSTDVTIGASSDSVPEWGAIVLASKRSSELVEFDMFRVKAVGLPIGLTENEWSEASVTAQAFQDRTRGGVFSMRHVNT